MNRSDEGMFEGFRPKVIEEYISHINLADLNHAHGDDADENEPDHIGI
jgi:hypothetical protein